MVFKLWVMYTWILFSWFILIVPCSPHSVPAIHSDLAQQQRPSAKAVPLPPKNVFSDQLCRPCEQKSLLEIPSPTLTASDSTMVLAFGANEPSSTPFCSPQPPSPHLQCPSETQVQEVKSGSLSLNPCRAEQEGKGPVRVMSPPFLPAFSLWLCLLCSVFLMLPVSAFQLIFIGSGLQIDMIMLCPHHCCSGHMFVYPLS